MRYEIILWDMDETLLDFKYSEKEALTHAFSMFQLNISEEIIRRYSEINQTFWKRLEKGEVTKEYLLRQRFVMLFQEYDIQGIDVVEFGKVYRYGLSTFVQCREGAMEVLKALHGKVRQFLVTNGVGETQRRKAASTGIETYMEALFISEDMGAEKPQKRFFDGCFEHIGKVELSKVLIVGDSLSSDIAGGKNAGIHTCWYHRPGAVNDTDLEPDYEITQLKELLEILK